jgi:hypothetical protein
MTDDFLWLIFKKFRLCNHKVEILYNIDYLQIINNLDPVNLLS